MRNIVLDQTVTTAHGFKGPKLPTGRGGAVPLSRNCDFTGFRVLRAPKTLTHKLT